MKALPSPWPARLGIAARAAAAILGGYTLAALASVALALALPAAFGVPRAEAVTWGLLLSFAVYAAAAMWAFAARSAARAWAGLALAALLLGLPALLQRWGLIGPQLLSLSGAGAT